MKEVVDLEDTEGMKEAGDTEDLEDKSGSSHSKEAGAGGRSWVVRPRYSS